MTSSSIQEDLSIPDEAGVSVFQDVELATLSDGSNTRDLNEETPSPPPPHVETAVELPPEKSHKRVTSKGDAATDAIYPKAVYCPITLELFQDPVVSPKDGLSYEKAALLARDGKDTPYYTNRSLKSILDEMVEYRTSSGLKRFQHSVRQFSQQLLWNEYRPLADGYYCPITLTLIHVPVIDPEGYSYEQVAIQNWIRCNGASPVTRRTMTLEELVPNRTLAALMEEEKAKSEDSMHPIFKQWKEEPAPVAGTADVEGSVHGSVVATFPSTPEQLEEFNRLRRIRRYQRCHIWCLLIIVLGILAWLVPVFSTVILVFVLVYIGVVTGCSSSNETGSLLVSRNSAHNGSRH